MKLKTFWITTFVVVLSACNTNMENIQEDHEDETVQYFTYSNDLEVFIEGDVLIQGESAELSVYFSSLSDFQPLDLIKVTTTISIAGEEVNQIINNPLELGTYSFNIEPNISGKGTIRFDIESGKGTFIITVQDIMVYSTLDDFHDEEEEHELSSTNTTIFTKDQSWKIDFATAIPTVEEFGQIIKTVAKIEPIRNEETVISSKVGGIVLFTDNELIEGIEVSESQKLFSISSDEMAKDNIAVQLMEAKSSYETSKANFERKSELIVYKLVSEQEMLNSKNTYETAKAVYENLVNNFSSSGQIITSSMSGFVKQVLVSNGQYVNAGQPLMVISQNKNLILTAYVQQKYLEFLPFVVSANIKTLQDNKTYSLEELNGKVLSYGKSATGDSYLLPVNLQITNKNNFVPGTFTEVFLKTLTNSKALTVPNSALIEEQGIYHVFVQITPELFEKREVKIGNSDGTKTEIINGIKPGERVVIKGAMQVKLAQSTGNLDAHSGHIH